MSRRDWALFVADMQEACSKIADVIGYLLHGVQSLEGIVFGAGSWHYRE